MMTKRGPAKRKDDAPRSPRPAAKRKPEAAGSSPDGATLKKKKSIPLAASGARRTLLEIHIPETNTEEGSLSFRGFMPQAPPHRREGNLPPFGLRDETSSEASHHGSEIPIEEPIGAAFEARSLTSPRTQEEAEPTPEPSPLHTPSRVKHMAQRKKFGPQGRLASLIFEAEEMLGRPTYNPSEVEGFQPELNYPADSEEDGEGEETPEVSISREEAPSTPVAAPRGSTPLREGNNYGIETNLRTNFASTEPGQAQQLSKGGTTRGSMLVPEQIIRDTLGAEEFQRSDPPPNVEA